MKHCVSTRIDAGTAEVSSRGEDTPKLLELPPIPGFP